MEAADDQSRARVSILELKAFTLKPMDDPHPNVSIEEVRLREIHTPIRTLDG